MPSSGSKWYRNLNRMTSLISRIAHICPSLYPSLPAGASRDRSDLDWAEGSVQEKNVLRTANGGRRRRKPGCNVCCGHGATMHRLLIGRRTGIKLKHSTAASQPLEYSRLLACVPHTHKQAYARRNVGHIFIYRVHPAPDRFTLHLRYNTHRRLRLSTNKTATMGMCCARPWITRKCT